MHTKFITLAALAVLTGFSQACVDPDPYDSQRVNYDPDPKVPDVQPTVVVKPLPTDFLSAKETVAGMGAGWNLGNTLDSHSGDTTNMWIECWGPAGIPEYEKAWGQVPATRELFHMLREAGFRAIRIPVTWYPHMGTKFDFSGHPPVWYPSANPIGYTVDKEWMDRVKQVIDYVLAEDMYCILNVHHDTGTSNTHWIVASEENYNENNERFKSLWTQIANTFKDYDGRLLFEGYNEMTDAADSWCFASYNTPSRYDAAIASSAYKAVNAYAQDFVNAVRATGGNNAERNLIVNTYAAASGEGDWNDHLKDPLKEMEVPADKVKDHIILQVHYYPSFSSLSEAKSNVDSFIDGLNKYLVVKGAPVIIGEWGSGSGSGISYDKNRSSYLSFAQYFVGKAKANGMATFYWMGISDGKDRAVPKFTQSDLKDAIISGVTPSL